MPSSLDAARTGNSTADLKQAILDNLYFIQGLVPELATPHDWYMALSYTVRDRMMADWITKVRCCQINPAGGRHNVRVKITKKVNSSTI